MAKYIITIKNVEAASTEQAVELSASLQNIANTLSAQDVIDLSKLLIEKPSIVQRAKEFKHLL